MPIAMPLVMASPHRARCAAKLVALSRPPAVGLREPTIASCGSDSAAASPRTNSPIGASLSLGEQRRIAGGVERDEMMRVVLEPAQFGSDRAASC